MESRPRRFIRLPAVIARTGLSRATIYRRGRDPGDPFPAPVPLGHGLSAWIESEIEDWQEGQIRQRGASAVCDHAAAA